MALLVKIVSGEYKRYLKGKKKGFDRALTEERKQTYDIDIMSPIGYSKWCGIQD